VTLAWEMGNEAAPALAEAEQNVKQLKASLD
jgi:hypothetical protein